MSARQTVRPLRLLLCLALASSPLALSTPAAAERHICGLCRGLRQCRFCNGSAKDPLPCPACQGRTRVMQDSVFISCSICRGTGHARCSHCIAGNCSKCRGLGWLTDDQATAPSSGNVAVAAGPQILAGPVTVQHNQVVDGARGLCVCLPLETRANPGDTVRLIALFVDRRGNLLADQDGKFADSGVVVVSDEKVLLLGIGRFPQARLFIPYGQLHLVPGRKHDLMVLLAGFVETATDHAAPFLRWNTFGVGR